MNAAVLNRNRPTGRCDNKSTQNTQYITREVHGMTQQQADKLHNALLTIWEAYPEVDTRISEGFEYIASTPFVLETFKLPSNLGKCFYSFENTERSDYKIAEMLESYDGETIERGKPNNEQIKINPEQLAAIAEQTITNLEKLKEFSIPIAERSLACLIRTVCEDNQGLYTAKQILDSIENGTSTIEKEARKIRRGEYGPLVGSTPEEHGAKEDQEEKQRKREARERAITIANRAEDFIEFCTDIRNGEWFKEEQNLITTLCADKNIQGFTHEDQTVKSGINLI
jgi:hypothetical protein